MKTVIIRADACKSIGFGHFIRSLALAAYLKDQFICYFFTFNTIELRPSRYQLDEISKVAKYIPIEACTLEEYNQKFLGLLKGDEIVVLDNYYYPTEYQQHIKDKGCKLVYVDGMNNQHYVSDVLISPGEMTRSDFSMESYTFFLNGMSHSFLRLPFLNFNRPIKDISDIRCIVLAIGGADPYGLTNTLIKLIHEVNSKLKIEVIAGDTVEISPHLNSNVMVHRNLNAEQIASVFSIADIGFFSSSTICLEAIACQLPIAAGWYVDNQEGFYKFGVRKGFFMPLGYFLDKESVIKSNIERILEKKNFKKPKFIDFEQGKIEIINLFKSL